MGSRVTKQPNERDSGTVAGIIVTYHPSSILRENVSALRPQVDRLFLVDNGSDSTSRAMLGEISSIADCEVIYCERNLGIAAALNLGIAQAQRRGCSFAALFDQDSHVAEGFIAAMLETYRARSADLRLAMVAPDYIDERSGVRIPLPKDKHGLVRVTMTSGSFFPMSTFRQCGAFDEQLFIDQVDTEYCLRVRAQGLSIVQSDSAALLHSLGKLRAYRFLGRTFFVTNHSARRRYYITRNRIILYRRYPTCDPVWLGRDLLALVMDGVKIIVLEKGRAEKLRYTLLGIWHALQGRTGYLVEL